jgi:hypothetical protein
MVMYVTLSAVELATLFCYDLWGCPISLSIGVCEGKDLRLWDLGLLLNGYGGLMPQIL